MQKLYNVYKTTTNQNPPMRRVIWHPHKERMLNIRQLNRVKFYWPNSELIFALVFGPTYP